MSTQNDMPKVRAGRSGFEGFLKLSLKKNKLKCNTEKEKTSSSDVIILDDSSDHVNQDHTKTDNFHPKIYSPVVINDSSDISYIYHDEKPITEPSKTGNVSLNTSILEISLTDSYERRPSIGGWSQVQNIICATPKYQTTPSTPRDIANQSLEECSMNLIQNSQKKILRELYGDTWKLPPHLRVKNNRDFRDVSKQLDFNEDDTKREDIELPLNNDRIWAGSCSKGTLKSFDNGEFRLKNNLCAESIQKTPISYEKNVQKHVRKKRSTVKKLKGKSLTEMVELLIKDGSERKIVRPKSQGSPLTIGNLNDEYLGKCMTNEKKTIKTSQTDILTEIYGDGWKSVPQLFKTKKHNHNDIIGVSKHLDFNESDITREDVKKHLREDKISYLTGSDAKTKFKTFDNTERKSKKRLYTEKIPNTPEPKHFDVKKNVRKDNNNTVKKLKGKTVTELVESLNSNEIDLMTKKVEEVSLTPKVIFTPPRVIPGRLSFMASLVDNVSHRQCHIEALQYHDNFVGLREKLSRRLYVEFNRTVFDDQLDADTPIVWDTKYRTTAGTTTNRRTKTQNGEIIVRSSMIKLSTKVVDRPQRLRDTMIHEMCHVATWLIDHVLNAGHGPLWKKWATRALKVYPELGEISTKHDLEIHFKYTYRCTGCGYRINRHKKNIDITEKACGYCRGTFEILLNKKTKDGEVVSTPARTSGPNQFALYVKENYKTIRDSTKTHAEVMKILGEQYSARKRKPKDDSV